MSNFQLLVLLDSITSGLIALTFVGVFSALGFFFAAGVIHDYPEDNPKRSKALKGAVISGTFAGLCMVLAAVTPNSTNLAKAHVIAEGAQVLTAENVEKLASELLKRVGK